MQAGSSQSEINQSKQLLEAIANAQATFIAEKDRRKAFDSLLSDILNITNSEYGFIGEILYTDEEKPFLKTYAITNIAWNAETQKFYDENAPQGMEFFNLDTLFGAALSTQEPVFANNPAEDSRAGGLPEGHPALNAFLGLPVYHAGQAVAMLGIANRPGGYDAELVDLLGPLLSTIGQLVNALRIQQEQVENQRRLQATIEGTNIGTWEWNVQTGETVFNERWANIVGYTLDELKPLTIQTWLDMAHPDDLETSAKELERHFAGDVEHYDGKCRMKHKDGYWVWVHDRGRVFSWTEDGKPLMMYGTHADITHEKHAEAVLVESESRLRALFELSPVGIALNNYEDGSFIEVNDALLAPTGYSREEFLSLSYWDITPKDYESQEAEQLQILNKTGRYGPYEKEYVRKDGERYPVLLSGVLISDKSGNQVIWSIVEDITERKRIDRMKNEFISTVSHELRTPLTSIQGTLKLIQGGAVGEITGKTKEMVSIALNNTARLSSLINDLLDMEKLSQGKMVFNMEVCSLAEQLEEAVKVNQGYAQQQGVRLSLQPPTINMMVNVDKQRIQQVLANLLSNAAKFSPQGGDVQVHAELDGERARVEVIDQGKGIDKKFQAKIFEKFTQADSSDSRSIGGTGLGLTITREIIEQMNGSISLYSRLGKGTTFYFELPIVK